MYRPDYRRYAILPPSRRGLKSDPRVQKQRQDAPRRPAAADGGGVVVVSLAPVYTRERRDREHTISTCYDVIVYKSTRRNFYLTSRTPSRRSRK